MSAGWPPPVRKLDANLARDPSEPLEEDAVEAEPASIADRELDECVAIGGGDPVRQHALSKQLPRDGQRYAGAQRDVDEHFHIESAG